MTLVPAYGRDYKSAAEVLAAWNENKDFQIASITTDAGRYTNKSDAEKYSPGTSITIRYAKMTKAKIVKV